MKYWEIDGNFWSKSKYTEAQAIEISKNLKNCKNCINCENCESCFFCENCKSCDMCDNCESRVDCKGSLMQGGTSD